MGLGMGSPKVNHGPSCDGTAKRIASSRVALIADAALVSASIVLGNHSTNADVGNKTATLNA